MDLFIIKNNDNMDVFIESFENVWPIADFVIVNSPSKLCINCFVLSVWSSSLNQKYINVLFFYFFLGFYYYPGTEKVVKK